MSACERGGSDCVSVGSLGPFGACMADGSEYTGGYASVGPPRPYLPGESDVCRAQSEDGLSDVVARVARLCKIVDPSSPSVPWLAAFQAPRAVSLLRGGVQCIACETMPCVADAVAALIAVAAAAELVAGEPPRGAGEHSPVHCRVGTNGPGCGGVGTTSDGATCVASQGGPAPAVDGCCGSVRVETSGAVASASTATTESQNAAHFHDHGAAVPVGAPCWVSFSVAISGTKLVSGESLEDAVASVLRASSMLSPAPGRPLVVGVGVNCCHPAAVKPALVTIAGVCQTQFGAQSLQPAEDAFLSRRLECWRAARLPNDSCPVLVAYPNAGEAWDAESREWVAVSGSAAAAGPATPATPTDDDWRAIIGGWVGVAEAAQMHLCVGGCCRTGPDHIARLSALSATASSETRRHE